MCGEKVAFDRNLPHTRGLPPHVRGKDDEGRLKLRHVGITPAYAGKRAGRCPDGCTPWDHPRVCGEKARTLIVQNEPQGSPPRMRGKVKQTLKAASGHGITPAYAGKSHAVAITFARQRDHPRVCGEKLFNFHVGDGLRGSPPRMRGKTQRLLNHSDPLRITPAYAGKRTALRR